jgi:hypothetical protein
LFDGSKKLHKRPKCPSCGLNSNLWKAKWRTNSKVSSR